MAATGNLKKRRAGKISNQRDVPAALGDVLIGLEQVERIVSCGGADTGSIPAQIAHSANPAQRKINEILTAQGKEKV
jgi:hypothetical protein